MGWVHSGGLPRGEHKAKSARLAGVAFALAAALPFPATAQQAQALVGGEILDSATLNNDADMDFGRIVPSASLGTVVMTASPAATCTTTGGPVHTGACRAAAFSGLAFFHADLRAQRPNGDRIDLTGPGGATMRLEDFSFGSIGPTVSLGASGANHRFRVDATDGSYTFYVGGTLRVGAAQAPGIYNGTFDIRITYN